MGQYYKILFQVEGDNSIELDIPNGFGTEFSLDSENNTVETRHQEYLHLVSGKQETVVYLENETFDYLKNLPNMNHNKEYSFIITPL